MKEAMSVFEVPFCNIIFVYVNCVDIICLCRLCVCITDCVFARLYSMQ